MKIKSIEITNIKGISNKKFELHLAPNKPNILVAPNGYGKSSFATAFDSLKSSKIVLDDKNYLNNNTANRPELTLTLSNGKILSADDNQNTISSDFDVFVINNQTEPKSTVQTFNGYSFAKTTLEIKSTVLVKTIPQKVDFGYSSSSLKSAFGVNGNRILKNISNLFNSSQLFYRLETEIDFSRFNLKAYRTIIPSQLSSINGIDAKGSEIKQWIIENVLTNLDELPEFQKIMNIIASFGFTEIENEADLYLTTWQVLEIRNSLGANFKKACKYLFYLAEKQHYKETISSFNPVKDRFDIKPKEEKNSLIVHWPKAHEISNGQRDILTFITLLLKSRRDFKKNDCILIIDEIFDYMDDANLISFQFYISTFIDEMKRKKRRIFPILLTHLDPLFFNHFCFNDSKIQVNYLKEINIKSNQNLLKLIYNREDESIKDNVDAYFFHFHPNNGTIDLTTEFTDLRLNIDWATPPKFFKKIFREIRRYIFENSRIDPIAICFGVRYQIEKLVYDKIPDTDNKRIFIEETNGTKNKLLFAQSIGIDIPETYFLLGIIYNTSLHLFEGQDISQPLGLKLENETIKRMLTNIFVK
ncbi:hypothetical protein [Psychroserpens sp. S379A]|uniref:hypothetical protein n=1 Tax=Psychroserpens sp. S379A TaxID=3415137 RepID=UPI003C7BBB15